LPLLLSTPRLHCDHCVPPFVADCTHLTTPTHCAAQPSSLPPRVPKPANTTEASTSPSGQPQPRHLPPIAHALPAQRPTLPPVCIDQRVPHCPQHPHVDAFYNPHDASPCFPPRAAPGTQLDDYLDGDVPAPGCADPFGWVPRTAPDASAVVHPETGQTPKHTPQSMRLELFDSPELERQPPAALVKAIAAGGRVSGLSRFYDVTVRACRHPVGQ